MLEKGFYLNDLPPHGEVTLLAVVAEKELRPKRCGGVYLHLKLADRTGELDAKAWDQPDELARGFDRDDVVKVRGAIEQYNEKPQLIVTKIRRCEHGEYIEADFFAASAHDPDEMFGQLLSFIEMIHARPLRELLRLIVTDPTITKRLKSVPAAMRIHHAFRAGLLEHIVSLCDLAVVIAGRYPRLNLDLLLAGAVLHDIGKIEALEAKGLRYSYGLRGQLIEHITLGLEILDRFAGRVEGFPIELKTLLQHLIVSHHGALDQGALRLPMFPEAIALHYMDVLDARMDQAFRLIEQSNGEDDFTAFVQSLNRQLFTGGVALMNGERGGAE